MFLGVLPCFPVGAMSQSCFTTDKRMAQLACFEPKILASEVWVFTEGTALVPPAPVKTTKEEFLKLEKHKPDGRFGFLYPKP